MPEQRISFIKSLMIRLALVIGSALLVASYGQAVLGQETSGQGGEVSRSNVQGPPPTDDLSKVTPIEVISGLKFPCGVTIQPGTGTVLVSESGAGQVVRVVDGVAKRFITDFKLQSLDIDPPVEVGPLGLVHLDNDMLLVGGSYEGAPAIHVFTIAIGDDEPRTADTANFVMPLKSDASVLDPVEPPAEDPIEPQQANLGRTYAMAVTPEAIFTSVVAGNSPDVIGRTLRANQLSATSTVEPLLDAHKVFNSSRPSGMTISPHGYLVVGFLSELDASRDGVIAFLDTVTRESLLRLETGLYDISAIAYSPRKQMYALDLAWAKPEDGGLYRIIADEASPSGMRAKKIVSLVHPTSMAFDSEGTLYVTIAGPLDDDGSHKGALLKILANEL